MNFRQFVPAAAGVVFALDASRLFAEAYVDRYLTPAELGAAKSATKVETEDDLVIAVNGLIPRVVVWARIALGLSLSRLKRLARDRAALSIAN